MMSIFFLFGMFFSIFLYSFSVQVLFIFCISSFFDAFYFLFFSFLFCIFFFDTFSLFCICFSRFLFYCLFFIFLTGALLLFCTYYLYAFFRYFFLDFLFFQSCFYQSPFSFFIIIPIVCLIMISFFVLHTFFIWCHHVWKCVILFQVFSNSTSSDNPSSSSFRFSN